MIIGFSGCSTLPSVHQAPAEDRSKPIEPRPETTDDSVRVMPIPDNAVAQSQADIKSVEPTLNTAIVPVSPAVIQPTQQNAAVIALLNTAEQQKQSGDLRSAQTSLQRAQRIAPRDANVYYALATTHRELQDYGLAEQVALKGVSIVQGQPGQLRRFWTLIAGIRADSGDSAGAKKAHETANRY